MPNSDPLICCGEKRPGYRSKDGWYCGCCCLNGAPQISAALIFVFAGFWFSLATLGDCKFAIVDDGYISSQFPGDFFPEGIRSGVGFLTFERPNGECYLYNDGGSIQETIARDYVDFLGSDWNLGRVVAVITPILSLVTWIYTWTFVCTSQIKAIRYSLGAVLCVVLVVLQGLTFTALTSSWCSENGCTLDRSSGLSIGALLSFFFGGLCFFASSDYPGAEDIPVVAASTKGEEVEEDPEQPVVVAEEEADKDEEAPEEQAPPVEDEEEASEGNVDTFVDAATEESTEIEA